MDRIIPQVGAIPLAEDHLNAQRSTMIGLGWFMSMVMGSATAVEGLGCVPTSPPSMAVQINPGMLCQGATIDSTQYGTLPLGTDNVSPLVKAGTLPSYDPTTMLFTLAAPTVSGQSINYLIEASLLEVDDLPAVLPYYNVANPLQALLGPGGNGTSVFTRRRQKVQLQLKAGVPAVDGFQTTPSADAGWVPLWIVTVKFGDTSINSSRIVKHPAAPFVVNKLPQLQPLLGGRIRRVLAADSNLYVSPTGSDNNDGQTSSTPFQTVQAAYNYMYSSLDLNNSGVTINCSAGTYTSGSSALGLPVGFGPNSFVTINGSGTSTVFAVQDGPCFTATMGARIRVQNMQVGSSNSPGNYSGVGTALLGDLASVIFLGDGITFIASGSAHMVTNRGAVITAGQVGRRYTIAGGAPVHMTAASGGTIDNVGSIVTLVGTPSFPNGFAAASPAGTISAWSCTFSGAATGPRYSVAPGGWVYTQGGGANYFPGSSAGVGAGATQGFYS